MFADAAIETLLNNYDFKTVLDIGAGSGDAGKRFIKSGKQVVSSDIADMGAPNTVVGDFMDTKFGTFDLVWASHVLEHQLNVNNFLNKCAFHMTMDSYICVTVPPLKHEIVGGHLTLWNAGLLMYNLILGGFDCRDAAVKSYGYNISVIAKKRKEVLPALKYDYGDIETLAPWFPEGFNYQGFNGVISELNWPKKG
jgi:SAM-dependent methyltransferase